LSELTRFLTVTARIHGVINIGRAGIGAEGSPDLFREVESLPGVGLPPAATCG